MSSCNLSLLVRVLLFKIRKPTRFRKLTIETERTFIFRSRGWSRIGWCQQCESEVELMSVVDAANETGLSELAIYQLIESGDIHFIEEANHIVVCLSSLRGIRQMLETRRSRNERILEGGVQENESDVNNEHS